MRGENRKMENLLKDEEVKNKRIEIRRKYYSLEENEMLREKRLVGINIDDKERLEIRQSRKLLKYEKKKGENELLETKDKQERKKVKD